MTAWNIVRFRVKPGRDEEFLAAHRKIKNGFPGMRRFTLIKTGESAYCVVGEWKSFQHMAGARPQMIATLNAFRDCLADLGNGLGVTDPVSGEAVLELKPKPAKKRTARKPAAKKARKPAKKKSRR